VSKSSCDHANRVEVLEGGSDRRYFGAKGQRCERVLLVHAVLLRCRNTSRSARSLAFPMKSRITSGGAMLGRRAVFSRDRFDAASPRRFKPRTRNQTSAHAQHTLRFLTHNPLCRPDDGAWQPQRFEEPTLPSLFRPSHLNMPSLKSLADSSLRDARAAG
jgi:hypothetical protein